MKRRPATLKRKATIEIGDDLCSAADGKWSFASADDSAPMTDE
jgi:hypothetical protein